MECLYCKAQMRRGTAPVRIDRNSYHISWDAISAWVCDQCGESLFETKEVDAIQEDLTVLDLQLYGERNTNIHQAKLMKLNF